jgi:hypothetical protein
MDDDEEIESRLSNEEKVELINEYQNLGCVHPLTCGKDSTHADLIPQIRDGRVVLVCKNCSYVQEGAPGCVYSYALAVRELKANGKWFKGPISGGS